MCNLMLYSLHSHFTSSQRLLNPSSLLMFDVYYLQVVWLARLLSYNMLDNTSNKSLGFLILSNEVMLYIDMIGVRILCRILCKCYAFLIVIHDGCQSFLHISHIRQTLPKSNRFLSIMASIRVLCLHRR